MKSKIENNKTHLDSATLSKFKSIENLSETELLDFIENDPDFDSNKFYDFMKEVGLEKDKDARKIWISSTIQTLHKLKRNTKVIPSTAKIVINTKTEINESKFLGSLKKGLSSTNYLDLKIDSNQNVTTIQMLLPSSSRAQSFFIKSIVSKSLEKMDIQIESLEIKSAALVANRKTDDDWFKNFTIA